MSAAHRSSDQSPSGGKEFSPERAWNYALNLLSRRAYTEAEIRQRLSKRGAAQDLIDDIIERLERYRLVDDEAFAEALVRTQSSRKGPIALRHELRRKGVEESVMTNALQPLDRQTQLENAAGLLQRNAWRFRGDDSRRKRARAFAFLARRGFPAEVVVETIEAGEWLFEPDAEEPEADAGGAFVEPFDE